MTCSECGHNKEQHHDMEPHECDTCACPGFRAPEMVQHPDHYGGTDNPYEVRKVLFAWGLLTRTNLWHVCRYVARARKKDPTKEIEDLKKARFYLDEEIYLLENGTLRGMK